MREGQEQDALYQFLWNYDSQLVRSISDKDMRDNTDGFLKERVKRKLGVFKEIMSVASQIAESMFFAVWKDFIEKMGAEKQREKQEKVSQQEYIDKILDEKFQAIKDALQLLGEDLEEKLGEIKEAHQQFINRYVELFPCRWIFHLIPVYYDASIF